jgi:thiol-disulfide isomerase/thioredoxin
MAKATEPIADRLLRIMEPVTRAPRMRRWELMVTTVLAAALLPSVRQQASPAAEPVPGSAPDALSGTQLHESAAPYRAVESISTEESGPARHDSSAPLPANGESNLNVLVRDRAGAPVAGVQAHLRHGGKSFVFDGNAQGVVRIELPAPPADLQFPFFDITWPGFTRSHTVSIKRGEPLPETLEVTLPVTRTVRGRLIDHEDRPVTKARICSGFTAANVAVPMRDWPNGEFVVQAAATDPKFGPNREGPILLAVEAPDLAVAVVQLTETGEPLTIRLGPGKPVGGRVVDPQGAPVAGVRLISDFVGPSNPPILKIETVTDATGIFWFAHYPADVPMKFSVMHSEYANLRMQEFTPGKVDYQLMLQPVLIVAGRVVDAVTDEPLGQIVVQQGIIGGGRTNWRSKRPVAFFEGRFEMKFAEAPTNTALRIIADGFQPLVLEPPINQYSKPNQTFELRRSHVVSLRVLTADGQPAPGFVAELRGGADADMLSLVPAVRDRRMSMLSAALPIGAELDETGRARITNAPSGKQVLTVYDTAATVMYQEEIEVGPALATKEHVIRIVPAPVAAVPARPAPGASDSNARTAAAKPAAAPGPTGVGNILVRAVRDGKPLVMAQVGLIPKPGFQSQFQGRTGQDGTHLFGGLSPGPYEVEIYDGFIYVADQQLTKLRRSLLVAIEPGKTLDILALGGPGAALDGVLLDDAGKPMPGIFTLITYLGAEPPVGVRGGATAVPFMMEQVEQAKAAEPATDSAVLSSMTVHTDSAGKFTVPELAPGYYQVMFRRGGPNPDFQLHTQFAVKPDQRRVAVEFRPKRSGRLTPGQQLPRIDGRNLEGNEMQVAGIQGKVLLVEFWASWNKPSLIGMAAMKKLHEKFAGADVVLIGVNLDQDHDSMKRAALDHAVNWQQVHVPAEQANALLDGFGIRALPERLLVGKDGRLVAFGLDDDEMITAIETELRK